MSREIAGFWIGPFGALAVLYFLPTVTTVIRHAEDIALVVFINCILVAWPAALVWPA